VPVLGCPVQTFGDQIPGVLERYQRHTTTRLAGQAGEAVHRLAGRAGAGLLATLGVPLPEVSVASALGVNDAICHPPTPALTDK
jgi:hypothetical protein